MLHWVCTETFKLDFGIVIGRTNSDSVEDKILLRWDTKEVVNVKNLSGSWNMITQEQANMDFLLSFTGTTRRIIHEHLMWFALYIIKDCVKNLLAIRLYVVWILKRRNLFLTWHWTWFNLKTYSTLKRKRCERVLNIRQVYNICTQNNNVVRGPRSKMQQLLKLLDDDHDVSTYIVCEDGKTVRDIFWAHPDSIKLFNTFSIALIINSIYKTNKYNHPLLKIVGVTPTTMNYLIEFRI